MTSKHYDVIVIGVGAMGSAACYHLGSRGVKVLGIEQFQIPHELGSSGGHTRMTRSAYYEHSDYVPLIRRANELWRQLERETGTQLLHHVGGLYMGSRDGEVIAGSLRSAEQHQLPYELLDHATLAKRFPQFEVPDDYVALLEYEAGFLYPSKCIAAHARAARERGAEIHENERVLDWHDHQVRTDRAEYSAEKIIFCGGAWTSKLFNDIGVKLRVTRQVLAWFAPKTPANFDNIPAWGIEMHGGLYYGFPLSTEKPGLKFAFHKPAEQADPESIDRTIHPSDIDPLRKFLSSYIPSVTGDLIDAKVCMYTNSPDSHFVIDQHPQHRDIFLACGFSGHGFKFASVVGEILADLAIEGRTKQPAEFLSLKRLRVG